MPTTATQRDLDVLETFFDLGQVKAIDEERLKFRITGLLSFTEMDSKVITALGYSYTLKRSGQFLTLLIFINK